MIFIIIYKSWSVNFDSFEKLTIFGYSKVNLRNFFYFDTFAAAVFFAANRRLSAKKFGRTVHCHAFLVWCLNFAKPIFRNNPCYML